MLDVIIGAISFELWLKGLSFFGGVSRKGVQVLLLLLTALVHLKIINFHNN